LLRVISLFLLGEVVESIRVLWTVQLVVAQAATLLAGRLHPWEVAKESLGG
jgi:hypothetical protein